MNESLSEKILSFRPSQLGEVMSIDHLLPTMEPWQERPESIPKAILLHGPFGTGKTTLARIIASMAGARGSDIKEVNAGNDRKIDDVRALEEMTRYKPFGSRMRVFIIDEFHGYVSHAQTALLKVIEEPPAGNMFILVTSDPFKVLPQIRSRCLSLETKLLPRETVRTLVRVASGFQLSISQDAATALWKASGGHARDVLKLAAKHVAVLAEGLVPEDMEASSSAAELQDLLDEVIRSPELVRPAHLSFAMRPNLSPYETTILDNSLDSMLMRHPEIMYKIWPALLELRVKYRQHLLQPREYISGALCLLMTLRKE